MRWLLSKPGPKNWDRLTGAINASRLPRNFIRSRSRKASSRRRPPTPNASRACPGKRWSVRPWSGDTLGFVDEYGFLSTDYDADPGTLRVQGAWGFKQQRIGESFFVADLLDSTRRSSRSYAGANAYGRTVQVTSTTYSACGLLFKNIPLKLLEANVRQLDESLELPAEEARRAKQNIKRVYVGKLAPPYLSDYVDFTRPSIKDRQEQDWDGDNLTIELQQVWLINQKTGRVYKKIDI